MSDPMHYRMTATMRILTERRSASLSKVIAAGLLLMLPMIQGCGQTGALYLLTTPEGSDANNSNEVLVPGYEPRTRAGHKDRSRGATPTS